MPHINDSEFTTYAKEMVASATAMDKSLAKAIHSIQALYTDEVIAGAYARSINAFAGVMKDYLNNTHSVLAEDAASDIQMLLSMFAEDDEAEV